MEGTQNSEDEFNKPETEELVSLGSVFHSLNNAILDEDMHVDDHEKFDLPEKRFRLPTKNWKEIYSDLGMLQYKSKTVCKVIELQVEVRNDEAHSFINLMSSKEIQSLVKQAKTKNGYKYLHIGSIIAGCEPLYRKGIPATVFMTLLDVRHNRYCDMLMGGISAPMAAGATAFDVVPNFAISLSDPHLDKVLMFQFGTHYLDMKPGSRTHALYFALYGRLFNTTVPIVKDPRSDKSKAKYSLLWQTQTKGAQLTVPKMINLADIQVPKNWIIDTRALQQRTMPKNLTTIASIKETPGKAHILFDEPNSRKSFGSSSKGFQRIESSLSTQCNHLNCIPDSQGSLYCSNCKQSFREPATLISNPLTQTINHCEHPQFSELDDGSLQCDHCKYVKNTFHVRMILSGHNTPFSEPDIIASEKASTSVPIEVPKGIPPFCDFMLNSSDDKFSIPYWPQHVIAQGQPDATT